MSKNLYVGNIPWSAGEEEIRDLFSAIGEVHNVSIINDRMTGRPRGFCFVEMENADEAVEKLNDTDLGGRMIKVNEARERQKAN